MYPSCCSFRVSKNSSPPFFPMLTIVWKNICHISQACSISKILRSGQSSALFLNHIHFLDSSDPYLISYYIHIRYMRSRTPPHIREKLCEVDAVPIPPFCTNNHAHHSQTARVYTPLLSIPNRCLFLTNPKPTVSNKLSSSSNGVPTPADGKGKLFIESG